MKAGVRWRVREWQEDDTSGEDPWISIVYTCLDKDMTVLKFIDLVDFQGGIVLGTRGNGSKVGISRDKLLKGGLGIVIGDEVGQFIVGGCSDIPWCGSALIAKALAEREALLLAAERGYKRVICEGDCYDLMKMLGREGAHGWLWHQFVMIALESLKI
ncbi:hypothetical protein RJ639_029618 [Escallonia herrerae]|uniref:RNase H type-1 domain-containing protein n=1 Tax=Escallonia herrerae TaxID=1293975 RepID=A0AA88X3W1_9ASTE|nr:hypothetical protein RJ639_029618 [Escallonia herrerae]